MKARLWTAFVGVLIVSVSAVQANDAAAQPAVNAEAAATNNGPRTAMFESGKATEKLEEAFEIAIERVQEIPHCAGLFFELQADGVEMLSTTIYMPTHPFDEQSLCQTAAAFTWVGGAHTRLCRRFSSLSKERAAMQNYLDPTGRWAVEVNERPEGQLGLWDLTSLHEARPRALKRSGWWHFVATDFHPSGDWVVANTGGMSEISSWSLSTRFPDVVDGGWYIPRFTPDGRYLVTHNQDADQDGMHHTRLWPLPGSGAPEVPDLKTSSVVNGMDIDAKSEYAVTSFYGWSMFLIPFSGEEPRWLGKAFPQGDLVEMVFSPNGEHLVGATAYTDGQPTLRVLDLQTLEIERVFDQPTDPGAASGEGYATRIAFADEDTFFTAGTNGLLRWDLETGTYERIRRAPPDASLYMSMAPEGRKLLLSEIRTWSRIDEGRATLFDLDTGEARDLEIPGHGAPELSPDGTLWLSAEEDGTIMVGRIEGGDPHLLLGHEGGPWFPATISPDNQWVASGGSDRTIRLWPMPDLDKPPLHVLPHAELIAKLKTLTNLRVVRDEAEPGGWKLEIGPFPGWAEVPEW